MNLLMTERYSVIAVPEVFQWVREGKKLEHSHQAWLIKLYITIQCNWWLKHLYFCPIVDWNIDASPEYDLINYSELYAIESTLRQLWYEMELVKSILDKVMPAFHPDDFTISSPHLPID